MAQRISKNVERGQPVAINIDGVVVSAYAGETLATVLLAAGISTFNRTRSGKPRGPYCNMGTCFECQVKVAAAGSATSRWQRACMCPVEAGMTVVTGARLQTPATEPHVRCADEN